MHRLMYALCFFCVVPFATTAHAETWIMCEGVFAEKYQVKRMGCKFKEVFATGQLCQLKQLESITSDPEIMNSPGDNFNVLKGIVNGEINREDYANAFILNGTRGYLKIPAFRACVRVE